MFARSKTTDPKTADSDGDFEAVTVEEVVADQEPATNGKDEEAMADAAREPEAEGSNGAAAPNGPSDTAEPVENGAEVAAGTDRRRGQTLGERLSEIRARLQQTPAVIATVTIMVRTGAGLNAVNTLLVPAARHLFLLNAAMAETNDFQQQRDMETLVASTIAGHLQELEDERERLEAANRAGGTRADIRFSGERRLKVALKAPNAMQLIQIVQAIDALATTIHVTAFSGTIDVAQTRQLEDNLTQRSSRLVNHLRKLEVQALKGYNEQLRRQERARRQAPGRRMAPSSTAIGTASG